MCPYVYAVYWLPSASSGFLLARKCNWLAKKMLTTCVMRDGRAHKLQWSDPTVHSSTVIWSAIIKESAREVANVCDVFRVVASSIIGEERADIHIFVFYTINFFWNCFYGVWTRIYEYHPPPSHYRACYGPVYYTLVHAGHFRSIFSHLCGLVLSAENPQKVFSSLWNGKDFKSL